MSCPDICTAAKCKELEEKINDLIITVNSLEARYENHVATEIPSAHNYEPDVNVSLSNNNQRLTVDVEIDSASGSDTIELDSTEVENVSLQITPQGNNNYLFTVNVDDASGEATLTLDEQDLSVSVMEIGLGIYSISVQFGEQEAQDDFAVYPLLEDEDDEGSESFSVGLSYANDYLTISIDYDGRNYSDTVYLPRDTNNNYYGGGGNGNDGGDSMSCEQLQGDIQSLENEMQDILAAILQAIAGVSNQVTRVQEYVVIDVEGKIVNEFDCPKDDTSSSNEEPQYNQEVEYQAKALIALHELTKEVNNNLLAVFKTLCDQDGNTAIPAWWQVRLGADVPQIVCTFRKGATSTYHSLSIPHPASTDRPTTELLPRYNKGSWQGMITCKDNSKFIINCDSKVEAERMCAIAVQLIDGAYLELPPRIYVGERKGQAVSVDPMIPATIMYYETGQQSLIPNWRVRVSDLEQE